MGIASQYVEITSSFSASHRRTIATTIVASLAFPICLCRASLAATVFWRAVRRLVYSACGWGNDCLRVAWDSLLLEWMQINVASGERSWCAGQKQARPSCGESAMCDVTQRHARQASRPAKRRQAAALQNGPCRATIPHAAGRARHAVSLRRADDARSGLRLRFGGYRHVHWGWRGGPCRFRDLICLVIAIPDGFAGSLPEARADPGEDHQLA